MTAAGLAGVLAVALLADGVVLVLAAALALGVLSTQFGLLAHDVAHKQVFRSRRNIAAASLVVGNILIGMSYTWWREKHDRHHATPNHVTRDPDCDISVLVLAPGQRGSRSRFVRAIVPGSASTSGSCSPSSPPAPASTAPIGSPRSAARSPGSRRPACWATSSSTAA